jgi:hypothetical protein
VLFGRMNDLGDAAQMMKQMDVDTRRTNPVLLKRGAGPVRLGAPAAADEVQRMHDDPRVPRGVIFERKGEQDYARKYFDSIEEETLP